ncbi:MAG: DUF1761 family protein [Bacteroidetes bacterium]|nr:DUF1761 family protein [Bacteroidota bacterium]
MNTNKLLVGALLGGVAYFFIGWVLYGIIFKSTMESMMAASAASVTRSNADMDFVALIIGNLVAGFLLAYIFERWAGIRTFKGGLIGGATVGFLIALSYDSVMLATTTLLTWGGVILDSVIYAVMGGLVGGVIGWWLGYKR